VERIVLQQDSGVLCVRSPKPTPLSTKDMTWHSVPASQVGPIYPILHRLSPGNSGPDSAGCTRRFHLCPERVHKHRNGTPAHSGTTTPLPRHRRSRSSMTGRTCLPPQPVRRALAPWTYRRVVTRIKEKAQENRVRLEVIDPRNTSRTCPECGTVSKESRRGEDFCCVRCDYTADADHVGARNVLARTLRAIGSVESPKHAKVSLIEKSIE